MIKFAEPQPAGRRDHEQFKKELLGSYLGFDHNSKGYLVIERRKLITYFLLDTALEDSDAKTFSGRDTTVLIPLADTLGSDVGRLGLWMRVTRYGDKLGFRGFLVDTVLDLDKGDILRKHRGSYVINSKLGASWSVSLLIARRDSVQLSKISATDKTRIWSILNISDSSLLINPTRREFGKLVKARLFHDGVMCGRTNAQALLE